MTLEMMKIHLTVSHADLPVYPHFNLYPGIVLAPVDVGRAKAMRSIPSLVVGSQYPSFNLCVLSSSGVLKTTHASGRPSGLSQLHPVPSESR